MTAKNFAPKTSCSRCDAGEYFRDLMKILLDHPNPFLLAHGGLQIQVEQTQKALQSIGVDVEYLRWWDDSQRGDIIHFFGRPSPTYIEFAHRKKIKVVLGELLTALGSRSAATRGLQKLVVALGRKAFPKMITQRFAWDSYCLADACVALTAWEARLMREIFAAPAEKIRVIPNGVEDVFFQSQRTTRGQWLVCTATIDPRKRVLELAQAAVTSKTPVWIFGKPYSAEDAYAKNFFDFVKEHGRMVKYEGAINDRGRLAQIYREARGFVLFSDKESLSLSALEAAACECPLLLSDLPWARTVFGENASYCSINTSTAKTAEVLRRFYDAAPNLEPPPKPMTWIEVAKKLQTLYVSLLKTS